MAEQKQKVKAAEHKVKQKGNEAAVGVKRRNFRMFRILFVMSSARRWEKVKVNA